MKQLLLLTLICALLTPGVVAQTQAGYVKTPGRMVGGKRVPGQGLTGATVQIKGRTSVLVKNANGSFSFPVPSQQFTIQSVKKNGYQLVDADAAPRVYSHTTAPIFLVMETPTQLTENKLKAERKLRNTLNKRLAQQEEEIESLKEQNRMTQEQYLDALEKLYELQESDERLISDMAAYYSRIDYDQIDEFNAEVSELILDGNLTRADSLLRSKGDIDERIRQLERHHDANVQMREELSKSEGVERMKRVELAGDCYSFFKRFALDNQLDSAMKYIEKRASLDTDNCQWQADAGSFLLQRGFSTKADQYFRLSLASARKLVQESPDIYEPLLAHVLNNIGQLYSESGNVADAERSYTESLELFRHMSQTDGLTYLPLVASTLNNMAVLYSSIDAGATRVEPLLREALGIYQSLAADCGETYYPAEAWILNNLGLVCEQDGRYEESEKMYFQALEHYQYLADKTGAYQPDYAAALCNLSALYFKNSTTSDGNGLKCLNDALQLYLQLAADDYEQYAPMLAVAYNNLSVGYFYMSRDEEGEQAFAESLKIYRQLAERSPMRYLPLLAKGLFEQGVRYYRSNELDEAESMFMESLTDYRTLASMDEDRYQPMVAKLLRNVANVYDKRQRWTDAEQMYQEELSINQKLASKTPTEYTPQVARTYGNLSNHAILMKDFVRAAEYARAGLSIDDTKLFIQANLAAALLFMGQVDEAEGIYRKYKKELKDVFLDDFRQFGALGVIPPEVGDDVERIKQIINQ